MLSGTIATIEDSMFATILGGLPRPPLSADASPDDLVQVAVRAQEASGLEPLTDGRLRWRSLDEPFLGEGARPLEAWRAAAGMTERAVKQALPGPYSLARRLEPSSIARAALTLRLADAIRAEVIALSDAGCPLVEIEESEAHAIGSDAAERALFRDAHLALTHGIAGMHLSLAIVGPSADAAGIETILAAPYASLAVDLIAGPDNWRLVSATPSERGIVAGAMSASEAADESPELILFAARYAASTQGRGPQRVGVAIAPGLEGLIWASAVRKLERLAAAARVAAMKPGPELAEAIDPRAIDIRSAAAGRREKPPPRRPRGTCT
jgi:methionine synthase II (cobalamin-independent)